MSNEKRDKSRDEIVGRSIFVIETVAEGVMVRTALLTERGDVVQLPAVFPNQEYALTQIEELRRAVIKHFLEATQIGVKVVAQAAQGPTLKDTMQ